MRAARQAAETRRAQHVGRARASHARRRRGLRAGGARRAHSVRSIDRSVRAGGANHAVSERAARARMGAGRPVGLSVRPGPPGVRAWDGKRGRTSAWAVGSRSMRPSPSAPAHRPAPHRPDKYGGTLRLHTYSMSPSLWFLFSCIFMPSSCFCRQDMALACTCTQNARTDQ